ncbi:MAG: transferrin receptor-like dimerization domain-containing protein, partial [Chthonomonadales bacterium]
YIFPFALLSLSSTTIFAQTPTTKITGFTESASRAEHALETRFDSLLKADNLRTWMKRLSERPHHVGSPGGKSNALYLAGLFKSFGFQTEIEEFQVLFPTPKSRKLELISPGHFVAKIEEPAISGDSTSGRFRKEQLPVYNAYSVDGDVTGPLVYVNYGIPKDYETLAERGIDVKGKIVIARYGGSWRGIKPKVAAEHGAIGCLIYSDPKDDGYGPGDVYPKGGFRNEHGAQRGSVADMPLYPGDPLTPGEGATKSAKRLPISEAKTLTSIPVMPISYGDALPLLKALEGPVAPADWRGGLPITYHIGAGPAQVHLALKFNWDTVTAYDIIAKLPGSDLPDEWVIRGNHHDGWVYGAEDPLSGTVALLEEARGVGELAKTGFRPKRTMIYCLWDGEEPGLLGSTEWVETHAEELSTKAVAYINSDGSGRGFLGVAGSHTLEQMIDEIARDVIDPETGLTVYKRGQLSKLVAGTTAANKTLLDEDHFHIEALGSGSDYSPFLQHLGIASLNMGYGGEGGGGSYHSIYDSFDHFTRFQDPTFGYGVVQAKTTGRATLRIANADIVPVKFKPFADTVSKYVTELIELEKKVREDSENRNHLLRIGAFKAALDPTLTVIEPSLLSVPPTFDLAPIKSAAEALLKSAIALDAAVAKSGAPSSATLDAAIIDIDRSELSPEGLPRRPWYRHELYAPGFYTGYGVKTLPGVREALEERKWDEAQSQIAKLSETLKRITAAIDKAVTVAAK